MADFDVADHYSFTLGSAEDDALRVAFEGPGEGVLHFSRRARADARAFVVISQGHASSSAGGTLPEIIDDALPPFLLSRRVFSELQAGASRLRPEWSEQEVEIRVVGRGAATLEARTVEVLEVLGPDLHLWVTDDPEWPVIIAREEGDNDWKLLGPNGEPVIVEPHGSVPQGASASSPPAEPEAAHLPAELATLFRALGDEDWNVGQDARNALRPRADDPGFADALLRALGACASLVTPEATTNDSEHSRRASRLVDTVEEAHLEHEPLATLLRQIALEHPNKELRDWTRGVLITNLSDAVIQQELVAQLEAGPIADPELAEDVIRATIEHLEPREARAKLEALIAGSEDPERLWHALLFALPGESPEWLFVLLDDWRRAEGRLRALLLRKLGEMRAWGEAYDPNDPEGIATVVALYREIEDGNVRYRLDEWIRAVVAEDHLPPLVELLDYDGHNLPGFFDMLLEDTPLEQLARELAAFVRRKGTSAPLWNLSEALLAREEAVWDEVFTEIARALEPERAEEGVRELLERIAARARR